MKKLIALSAISLILAASVFANEFNPPAFGESAYELSSPQALTDGSSTAGGAIFLATPGSICVNPALPAHEQRVDLNLGYTALFSQADTEFHYGNAFQAGIIIPSKLYIITGYVNGTMLNLPFTNKDGELCSMVNNNLNIKAALSKEITEKMNVGLGLNAGFAWGENPDWALSFNIGAMYDWGRLGFLSDFRLGSSLMNLGKCFANSPESNMLDTHETFCTWKMGAAGTIFGNENMKLGFSFDLSTPCFQNLIIDTGFKFAVKDMLTISVAEKFNINELCSQKYTNLIPSVGLLFKFNFKVQNNELLDRHEWGSSEMTCGAAYKNLYGDINAISTGVDLTLGMKDEAAPVIVLWEEE